MCPLLHAGLLSTSKADTAGPASNTMAFLGLQRHSWAGVGVGDMSHLLFRPRIRSFKETLTQSLEMMAAGTTQSLPAVALSEQTRGTEERVRVKPLVPGFPKGMLGSRGRSHSHSCVSPLAGLGWWRPPEQTLTLIARSTDLIDFSSSL